MTPEKAIALSEDQAQRLITFYGKAENEILTEINRAVLKGEDLKYLNTMKSNIKGILNQLRDGGRTWCEEAIPETYSAGMDFADKQIENLGLAEGFGAIHQQASQVLAEASFNRLEDVTTMIGRSTDDIYRELSLESVRGAVVGYNTYGQAATKIKRQLKDRGITGFKDKNGKMWNMKAYAAMVARTTTMEAHLAGTSNRLMEKGHDLVKVSSHSNSCPLCKPYQGAILSLSGTDKNYPSLQSAKDKGLFHPNCRHAYGLAVDLSVDTTDYGPKVNSEDVMHSSVVKENIERINRSSIPNNLLSGADRKRYFTDKGHSVTDLDNLQSVLNDYGAGGTTQLHAEFAILDALQSKSKLGAILNDQIELETSLHEYWASKAKASDVRLYRKGTLGKDVESWSSNEEGADMGGGGIGYDHRTTFAERKKEGYRVLGGGSKTMGAPGEGEITLIKIGAKPTPVKVAKAEVKAELATSQLDELARFNKEMTEAIQSGNTAKIPDLVKIHQANMEELGGS